MENILEEVCSVIHIKSAQIIFRGTNEECIEYLVQNKDQRTDMFTIICEAMCRCTDE